MRVAVGLEDGLGLDSDRCIRVIPRHQWPHKKDLCPQKIYQKKKKKLFKQSETQESIKTLLTLLLQEQDKCRWIIDHVH